MERQVIGKKHVVVLMLLVLLAGAVFVFRQITSDEPSVKKDIATETVANFEECLLAGYPVQESDPRKCTSSVGTVFSENTPDTAIEPTEYVSRRGVKITVSEPLSGAVLVSPVKITGKVPGNWSFEASFPVSLIDSTGITIAQTNAQLLGDWMTDEYVPFEATLTFDTPVGGGNGTLLIRKDNPSNLSENDDSLLIPVAF